MSGLTIRNGVDSTASGQQIRANDADVYRESDDTSPPPDDVTNQVDLLLGLVVGPEADTTQEERPVDRAAGIRMRSSETGVVLKHEQLQFGELAEEVH